MYIYIFGFDFSTKFNNNNDDPLKKGKHKDKPSNIPYYY